MARNSLIQREKKRQKLEEKYHLIRRHSKKNKQSFIVGREMEIHVKLESPPHNSAPIHLHRCCFLTERPRANYRDFGLSRHVLREMVHACLLPEATRSSW